MMTLLSKYIIISGIYLNEYLLIAALLNDFFVAGVAAKTWSSDAKRRLNHASDLAVRLNATILDSKVDEALVRLPLSAVLQLAMDTLEQIDVVGLQSRIDDTLAWASLELGWNQSSFRFTR